MDVFDFEELIANMLGVTDEQINEDGDILEQKFQEEFEITMDEGYQLAKRLLMHTPTVKAGLSGTMYHAFVNKDENVMLMKVEAKGKTDE